MKVSGGRVQIFFEEHGGKEFIKKLAEEFESLASIAYHLANKYDFSCSSASIRLYMVAHGIPRQPLGGNRHPKR
ncbi:MAG TPA: hypothetical protein ENH82_06995, partial [bacterium]|nr:hypothetical protein [bacterium]